LQFELTPLEERMMALHWGLGYVNEYGSNLYEGYELSASDIAEYSDIPVEIVNIMLRRAKEKIKLWSK
jgi:hypothetical protein